MKGELSILIVEDNRDDQILLEESLGGAKEFSAKLFLTESLSKAFDIVQQTIIDVAIIDLNLPDSSGLDTFLAFHSRYQLIPVIILSGRRDQALAFQAIQSGAQDYLFKGDPSNVAIIRSIRYAVERQRLTTELSNALERVDELEGLLPICSFCKNIKDEKGRWSRIESYISSRLDTHFSHSICPDCAVKHYPECFPAK